MLWTPSYDGNPIFGRAVKMQMMANPTENQVNGFFGINGVFNLFGGSRGRIFAVEGCLVGADLAGLNAAESFFHSYADGIARVLIDTRGRQWSDVVFDDVFQPDPVGPRPLCGFTNGDGSNWLALRYKAMFRGLL